MIHDDLILPIPSSSEFSLAFSTASRSANPGRVAGPGNRGNRSKKSNQLLPRPKQLAVMLMRNTSQTTIWMLMLTTMTCPAQVTNPSPPHHLLKLP